MNTYIIPVVLGSCITIIFILSLFKGGVWILGKPNRFVKRLLGVVICGILSTIFWLLHFNIIS